VILITMKKKQSHTKQVYEQVQSLHNSRLTIILNNGPIKGTITLLNRKLQVNRLMIGVGKSHVNNGNRIRL